MTVRDMLIALVRYAIKGEELDKSALEKSLSPEKLDTLFKVAKKHDVAHLVCYALEKTEIIFENSDIWRAFLKEKDEARLRYEMIQADINEIFACFDSEGIDYMPLKGAVVRAHYPEPWMRTSCDIDILVQEKELDRAVNALVTKCKYKTDGKKTYHDMSLYSPFGMHLELHHNIKESEPKYDALLSQVWKYSYRAGEGRKYLQSKEFLMLHLIAHMAYHFVGGGCGLRSVIDIWILEHNLEFNKEELEILLKKAELSNFYHAINALGAYWLDQREINDNVILEVEKHVLLGGVYGTRTQNAIAGRVKKGSRIKYFCSRIFMPYRSLVILYPIIKKHKILTPFCQVARWFSVIFKRKRIAKEIKNVAGADKSQIEKMRSLFESLGL